MTVGELLRRADSRELTEWAAYEREYGPLGPERGDWQAALVAYTTASMLSTGNARPKITDFVLRWARSKRQSAEEQLNIFRALAASFEKKDEPRGNDR